MTEITSVIISAAVSFLVARLTVGWEFKFDKKVRQETAKLELCLSIIDLMSETESNPDRRAEDSFAAEVCRVNFLAKLNAPKELSDAIEKYSANYLEGFKIFKVNDMNLYDIWHSLDCWEDEEGNPANVEHSLADEQGESGYISARQKLMGDFITESASLAVAEHQICKMALDEAAACGQ